MNKKFENNKIVQTSTMIKRDEEPEEERNCGDALISKVAPLDVGG
jgi:hypothetical protein